MGNEVVWEVVGASGVCLEFYPLGLGSSRFGGGVHNVPMWIGLRWVLCLG